MCPNTGLYFVFTQQFDRAVEIYNLICQMSTQNHSLGEGGDIIFAKGKFLTIGSGLSEWTNLDKAN